MIYIFLIYFLKFCIFDAIRGLVNKTHSEPYGLLGLCKEQYCKVIFLDVEKLV